MIEKIEKDKTLFAIILRADFKKEGIEFFSPPQFSQQLGYMKRKKGHTVMAHTHRIVERTILMTQEVLLVKSGKVKVTLYDQENAQIQECILHSGDTILLAEGGHAVEMLEDSELIEVKQGPYESDNDKILINTND